MDRLIFVGGIPYSGKSHFGRRLQTDYFPKYQHLETDELVEQLIHRRQIFMGIVEQYYKKVYRQIRALGDANGITGDYDLATFFAAYMKQEGRFSEFSILLELCACRYGAEIILESDIKLPNSGLVPVIDGSFTGRSSRSIMYQELKDTLGTRLPLDEMQKLFVYFDIGLEVSLERLKGGQRAEKKSLVGLTEGLVSQISAAQEIPTIDEFPNLEVAVIRNFDEIERTAQSLA